MFDRLRDRAISEYFIESGEGDAAWRAHELELLNRMEAYCNSSSCLRKNFLEYFGESAPARCNNCGCCEKNKNDSWRKFFDL